MAWIELHQAIWTHRKTLILAAELDLDETYAAAHMIRLWTWALDNAPEGDLSGLPAKVIAYGAGWRGDPDVFVKAAVRAGWLDQDGDGLRIHDWYDYAGRLIEQRQYAAQQKRRHRELYSNKALVQAIRERDKDRCRYCGRVVNWRDRKGPDGATYDYIDPSGPTSLENVVVACRACNAGKGQRTPEQAGYVLLPPPAGYLQKSGQGQVKTQAVSRLTLPNRTIPNRTSEIKTSSPAGEGLCNLAPAEICEQQGAQQRECAKTAPGKKPAPTVGKAAGKGEDYSEEFEEFWKLYPRKVEKRRAFRCWKTRLREGASPADIIAASRNYASYCHKRGIDLQFIKHPATFLGTDKPYEEWIAGEEGKTIAQGSQHSQPVPADQRLNLDKFLWPGKGA